jgi:hypothetical protein
MLGGKTTLPSRILSISSPGQRVAVSGRAAARTGHEGAWVRRVFASGRVLAAKTSVPSQLDPILLTRKSRLGDGGGPSRPPGVAAHSLAICAVLHSADSYSGPAEFAHKPG